MESRILIANGLIAVTAAVLIAVPLIWWIRTIIAERRRRRSRRRDSFRAYLSNAAVTQRAPRAIIEEKTQEVIVPDEPRAVLPTAPPVAKPKRRGSPRGGPTP